MGKQFVANWGNSFAEPGSKTVGEAFFKDHEYTEADGYAIGALQVGQFWVCPQYGFEHVVTRIQDVGANDAISELEQMLQCGIEAGAEVTRSWERGDLAGAVNGLDGWVEMAQEFLQKRKAARKVARKEAPGVK